jgi:hypothetical protein
MMFFEGTIRHGYNIYTWDADTLTGEVRADGRILARGLFKDFFHWVAVLEDSDGRHYVSTDKIEDIVRVALTRESECG